MSVKNRYVSHSTVWANQKDDIIDSIIENINKAGFAKKYNEKREMYDILDEELSKYSMHLCNDHIKTGVVKWRIAYVCLVVFQWVFWPYCFFNWLRTGNFRINPRGRIGHFIDKI